MSRYSYTSVADWMSMTQRELEAFWRALCQVLEREHEAREEARKR